MVKSTPNEHETESVPVDKKITHGWSMNTIFWGSLFILIGVLLLLANFGILQLYFDNIWQLWPLFIIGLGISILGTRGLWLKIISGVLVIASLGLVAFVVTSEDGLRGDVDKKQVRSQAYIKPENDQVKRFDLNVETGAMKLNIDSGSSANLATATLNASPYFDLVTNSKVDGETQKTTINTKGNGFFWNAFGRNEFDVQLSRDITTKLLLDTGAATIDADVSLVKLTDLTIDTGASSVKAKLGSKENNLTVTIDAGASSIILRVPKESGVRVQHDGGATKIDFDDVDKVRDDFYESSNFNTSAKKITIKSDTGASTFTIKRY